MDPRSSGRDAFKRSSSKAVNFPRPKFFTTPPGPNKMGVAKYGDSVISDAT